MAFVPAPSLFPRNAIPLKRPRRPPTMQIVRRLSRTPTGPEDVPKAIRIAFTREQGKNKDLMAKVYRILPHAEVVEVSCVETVIGEHRDVLPQRISIAQTGWLVITSPEAAAVFIEAWRIAGFPPLGRIAAVGRTTGDALRSVGLHVDFEPSKATAKTLVKEFPAPVQQNQQVLYPASAKASEVVVEGLTARGYTVTRLNTYSTETVKPGKMSLDMAEGAHIVTFASPSAVKGWVENIGVREDIAVACIGETSASAARKAGFRHVHYPDKPGTEGWITAICDAVRVFAGSDLTGVIIPEYE